MQQSFEGVYENGVIRPVQPIAGIIEGQQVVVTMTYDAHADRQEADFLAELAREGLLDQERWGGVPARVPFQPLAPIGKPLSQIILEDRE